jgi:hypothetical protein
MTTTEKELTVRARAFTGRGVETIRVLVRDGVVRVWDSIAGHYTTCHSLSQSAVRRIVRLAADHE